MEKFILGKKVGMTQVFTENGVVIPVTVIEAGPCTVVQTKSIDKNGYSAVKLGYEEIAEKKLNKPAKGLFLKTKISAKRYLKEFRVENSEKYEIGSAIDVSTMFQDGDKVDVTGVSKGKGFQGAIKRHGYSRGPETHGSTYHRRVGSLGTIKGKVFKAKKLPGHMGAVKVTVQNLSIVKVDKEKNLLLVKGAVPGIRGSLLVIKDSVKSGK